MTLVMLTVFKDACFGFLFQFLASVRGYGRRLKQERKNSSLVVSDYFLPHWVRKRQHSSETLDIGLSLRPRSHGPSFFIVSASPSSEAMPLPGQKLLLCQQNWMIFSLFTNPVFVTLCACLRLIELFHCYNL